MTKDRALHLARTCVKVDRAGQVQVDSARLARTLAQHGVKRSAEVIESDLRQFTGTRKLADYIRDPFLQLELPLRDERLSSG